MKTQTQKVEGGYELFHYWDTYPHYWDAYPSASYVVTVLIDPEGWFVMETSTFDTSPADGICANVKEIYEEMGWDYE